MILHADMDAFYASVEDRHRVVLVGFRSAHHHDPGVLVGEVNRDFVRQPGDGILLIVREEFCELVVELAGERLVVRDHYCGTLHFLDDVGHGERLARAGDAQQDLVFLTVTHALDELRDGLGLVAGRLMRAYELKLQICTPGKLWNLS
jgi:hypothetical protein